MDARSATAADFDEAAQRNANAFWLFAIVTGVVWWFASMWWAIVPGLVAAYCVVASISCTMNATKLREGRYRLPNPNNGAPDGDARNWPTE